MSDYIKKQRDALPPIFNLKSLQKAIGIINTLRHVVPNLANKIQLFYNLMKHPPKEWSIYDVKIRLL